MTGLNVLRLVLVGAAYFACARLGYAFTVGGMVSLWPPSGLMLGLLAIAHLRHWPAIVAGGLIGSVCSDLLSNYTVPLATAAALANGAETFVGALVLRRYLGSPVRFSTLRAVYVLMIGVVGVSNALTSFGGAAVLNVGFGMGYWHGWVVWWVGDGLGMLIVAPVILTIAGAVRRADPRRTAEIVEGGLLLAVVAAVSVFALGTVPAWAVHPGPYLLFPVLLWAGLRFGLMGASLATLIVACVAIWNAAQGAGPFAIAKSGAGPAIAEAYAFLAIASASSLIAAAALTERQDAIGQLRESREQYRNVVETATDPIITIDSRNRIRFANSATERVFGFSRGELLGRDLSLLIPGAKDKGLRRDGREIPLEVSYGRVTEPGAELTVILRDISEQRAAEHALQTLEEQYRQSQKMEAIGQLAGGIAHDFNNLLTIVQVNCELLLEQLPKHSELRPELVQVQTAAQRAASLTRQLLAFSRRQVLEPRVMSLADSLGVLEPMLKRLLGEHVAVRLSIPPDVGPVLADPGQVEQVIMNLALNARDAMPAGGFLTIELGESTLDEAEARAVDVPPGRYARLAVTDTGVGMDEETAARVFEPFFTTKPMGRGTGLGLSTVHGIVKQSGGGIRVRSQPGAGTTFEVFLPRIDAPVDRTRHRAETIEIELRRELVLVVEDEEDVGRLARRILERHGYRVLLAGSPAQALDIAARELALDALLTDVVLPGMSGRALAERLLQTHPRLRVLYMSGYTDDALSEHGVLTAGTAFIEKPFSADALVAKLREVIHGGPSS